MKLKQAIAAAAAALFVAACTSMPAPKSSLDVPPVAERLAQPLTADAAVEIAVLNNRRLQAAYAELDIAEADLAQAGRMRNPGFSFAKLTRGPEREIERTFTLDVVSLVTMPWRLAAERGNLEAARARTAIEVVRVSDEARRAWIEAVAAAQVARYAADVEDAAIAGAELAREMQRVGNFSKLARSREAVFQAEATTRLAQARHEEAAARERLVRALGLAATDAAKLQLPERLPDLPGAPRALTQAQHDALADRLDIRALRRETESAAKARSLASGTRWIEGMTVDWQHNTSNELPTQTGYEIGIEIPIFDDGSARVARAEAMYRRSASRLADAQARASSEVREQWAAYSAAYDVAKHYRDTLVPLRAAIAEEQLLRYNGMLVGVFELLSDAREQVAAVSGSIEAQRAFWLADARLEMALTTGGQP